MNGNDDRIVGRYRLEGRLGTGGMSTVRLAFDERLERQVAVKLLAEHLADDENFVSRFRREALAAARLVHPNIVQVFDFGLDEPSGQHYIVMEFVPGKSCAEILRQQRVLPLEDVLDIVGQACRGLDHAHRNGVVHRDVKPGNLMLSDDGVVKLADFGIAKAAEHSSITQIGSVLGTAAYLAPEQARGEEAGPPADQYALGVVAYQMLAGRLPYEATSLTELAFKQQRQTPPLLHEVNPEVPPALGHAVARALGLDAAARYTHAIGMAEAMRAGARGIEPPPAEVTTATETAATRIIGDSPTATEATVAMPERESAPARRPLEPRPRQERPGPPTPAPVPAPRRPAPARERRPERRRRGALSRALIRLGILLLVLVVAVVAAIWIADALSGNPELREVTSDNLDRVIEDVRRLIDDNTR
jgi:serine/threonine-protein kinase